MSAAILNGLVMDMAAPVAALLAGIALAVAVAALRGQRAARARCRSLEEALAAQRRELELVTGVSGHSVRLMERLNAERSRLAERLLLVEQRAGNGALDEAIGFARRGGAAAEDLRDRFGLSRGEAELVTRLHARRPRKPAA